MTEMSAVWIGMLSRLQAGQAQGPESFALMYTTRAESENGKNLMALMVAAEALGKRTTSQAADIAGRASVAEPAR
jgi:hypothetical protein